MATQSRWQQPQSAMVYKNEIELPAYAQAVRCAKKQEFRNYDCSFSSRVSETFLGLVLD